MDRVPHGPNPDGVPSAFKRSSRTIPVCSPIFAVGGTTTPTEAIDRARHAAAVKCLHHLAPDQDSGLMTLRSRPRASPRPTLAQRTSVRSRK
jgi:hypothetical protein